jgi:cytochrome c-type biogenesis protein CcmH
LILLFLFSGDVLAAVEPMQFNTPEQEHRYQELMKELRCLVCQNQSLAESNAGLAGDLRQITYEMVQDNKSDEEIVEFLVSRYGDFVLYRPPINKSTYLLWYGPAILFFIATIVVVVMIRRRAQSAETALDIDEKGKLDALLSETADKRGDK